MTEPLPMQQQEQNQGITGAELYRLRGRSKLPRKILAARLLWSIVQNTLFRYSFHTSNGWRSFLLRCFGARIQPSCTIRRTARVYYPWNLEMGTVTSLGDDARIYNLGKVTLGDHVSISQEAYICAGTHDYRYRTMPLVTLPIVLKKDAWVCARAFIGPGVTVGEAAIVGAGAVVTHDVPDRTIVAGNPAKVIKERPPFLDDEAGR